MVKINRDAFPTQFFLTGMYMKAIGYPAMGTHNL